MGYTEGSALRGVVKAVVFCVSLKRYGTIIHFAFSSKLKILSTVYYCVVYGSGKKICSLIFYFLFDQNGLVISEILLKRFLQWY